MTLTEEGLVRVPGLFSRWARLNTGVKAHYVTSGEDGPAVVLLHGGLPGASGTAGWLHMAPYLGAHGFRVYALDMPGFGLTEDPQNHYGYGQGGYVDFIHDVANALCLDRFHIGGNSMGCSNAVAYLVAHPERILSFALISGNIGDLVPRHASGAVTGHRGDVKAGGTTSSGYDYTLEGMRDMISNVKVATDDLDADFIEMRWRASVRNRDIFEASKRAYSRDDDVNQRARLRTAHRLETMTIPGIYCGATEDSERALENLRRQEDALPNVQFFYVPGAGHQGQSDQPEVHNRLFEEFFRDGRISWETAQRAGVSDRRPVNPELVAIEGPAR